jgi:tRNA modification GTPase
MLTERIDLEGIPVTLVDTAGLRDTADVVEREGVDRARRAVSAANLVLVILDHSEPLRDEDEAVLAETSSRRRIVVRNKSDRPSAWAARIDGTCFQVSALTGVGMTRLRSGIVAALTGEEALRDSAAISNVRHIDLLHRARASLARATDGLSRDATLPEEFILSDLQQARAALEEITGKRTTDDLLAHIFERFCVGK